MIYTDKNIRVINSNVEGYLTTNQFGIKHGLSHSTIAYFIKTGEIDAIKIGRYYYIPENAEPPKYKRRGRSGKRYYLCDSENLRNGEIMNSTSIRILECLSRSRGKTVREIWRFVSGRSLTSIYFNLEVLMKNGLITNQRGVALNDKNRKN